MDKANLDWEANSPPFSRKILQSSSLEPCQIMIEEEVKFQITQLLHHLQKEQLQNLAKIQVMLQLNIRHPKSKISCQLQI